jgi:hypothetical protein
MNYLSDVPRDIFLWICGFVSFADKKALRLCCKQFQVVLDAYVFTIVPEFRTVKDAKIIVSKFPNLKKFKVLVRLYQKFPAELIRFAQEFPQLREIYLYLAGNGAFRLTIPLSNNIHSLRLLSRESVSFGPAVLLSSSSFRYFPPSLKEIHFHRVTVVGNELKFIPKTVLFVEFNQTNIEPTSYAPLDRMLPKHLQIIKIVRTDCHVSDLKKFKFLKTAHLDLIHSQAYPSYLAVLGDLPPSLKYLHFAFGNLNDLKKLPLSLEFLNVKTTNGVHHYNGIPPAFSSFPNLTFLSIPKILKFDNYKWPESLKYLETHSIVHPDQLEKIVHGTNIFDNKEVRKLIVKKFFSVDDTK